MSRNAFDDLDREYTRNEELAEIAREERRRATKETQDMIPSHMQGIPCLIRVDSLTKVKPWRGPAASCPSDLDYYGYTEIEFTVCDRRGREAPWLEKKMSPADRERIEQEIIADHA